MEKSRTKIKICGITKTEEIEWLNELLPEYLGMILFFPKSKRNLDIARAEELLKSVSPKMKKVGVTVSPTLENVKEIESAGFDILQVHGELREEVLRECTLPILLAFNGEKMTEAEGYLKEEKIIGFLYDAKEPGSGECFDWTMIPKFDGSEKMCVLSGGLKPENVRQAIDQVHPDIVDVSSGVEIAKDIVGKDKNKIEWFIKAVRAGEADLDG